MWTTLIAKIQDKSKQLNHALAEIMIEHDIAFRLLDNPKFRNMISHLCPDWRLMFRESFSSTILPEMAAKVRKAFDVKRFDQYSLSIEFDYWQDFSHRSILGIIATDMDGNRYLISIIDVTGDHHSGQFTAERVLEGLVSIRSNILNCLINDAASSCSLARRKVIEERNYRHIISISCMAHLFNLIGQKFTSSELTSPTMSKAAALTAKISKDVRLCKKLKELGLNRVSNPPSSPMLFECQHASIPS